MDQLVKAINFYFSDQGHLPRNQTGWCTYISNTANNYGADFQADLQPYLNNMQFDPTKAGGVGDYLYYSMDNTNGHYAMCANMEQASQANGNYDYSSCTNGAVYNYCLTQ
jgi:hypothetical protein